MFVGLARRFFKHTPWICVWKSCKRAKICKITGSVPPETQSLVLMRSDGGCEKFGLWNCWFLHSAPSPSVLSPPRWVGTSSQGGAVSMIQRRNPSRVTASDLTITDRMWKLTWICALEQWGQSGFNVFCHRFLHLNTFSFSFLENSL